jgi:hypothetical protein
MRSSCRLCESPPPKKTFFAHPLLSERVYRAVALQRQFSHSTIPAFTRHCIQKLLNAVFSMRSVSYLKLLGFGARASIPTERLSSVGEVSANFCG